jgi:regulator of replication initiation timing
MCELEGIKEEIKKLSASIKKLRDKKNTIEKNIIDYLKNKDLAGLKINNNIISLVKKEHTVRKKKKEKKKDLSIFLQQNGIHISDKILNDIEKIQKGNKQPKDFLKISSSSSFSSS